MNWVQYSFYTVIITLLFSLDVNAQRLTFSSELGYFNNDENQAAYWSEGDEDDLNFQTDPDEASYTGGDLVE